MDPMGWNCRHAVGLSWIPWAHVKDADGQCHLVVVTIRLLIIEEQLQKTVQRGGFLSAKSCWHMPFLLPPKKIQGKRNKRSRKKVAVVIPNIPVVIEQFFI